MDDSPFNQEMQSQHIVRDNISIVQQYRNELANKESRGEEIHESRGEEIHESRDEADLDSDHEPICSLWTRTMDESPFELEDEGHWRR